MIFIWNWFVFKKHLTYLDDLDVVQVYEIFVVFGIPLFKRRIMLYDPSKEHYYEIPYFKLEDKLLELKKGSKSEDYKLIIEQHIKEINSTLKELKRNKKEIEKQEDKEFLKFIKIGISIIIVLILIFVIKFIFF